MKLTRRALQPELKIEELSTILSTPKRSLLGKSSGFPMKILVTTRMIP